jgi:hypothetical protein
MRNFFILLIIAVVAITILLFLFNPEILADIWLWIIGLIGPIVALVRNGVKSIANLLQKSEDRKKASEPPAAPTKSQYEQKIRQMEQEIERLRTLVSEQNQKDAFDGTTLTVLRYFDDGETTLGLLYFQDQFFCYTLEDTFHEIKVKGETRIPAGAYNLDYRRELTDLTKKYRKTRDWFDYHLHIQNIENFQYVYIHCGNDHTHTEGCLLIADSIHSSDQERKIYNSRRAYERLYKSIKKLKADGRQVRIKIFDENWFESVDLKNRYVTV